MYVPPQGRSFQFPIVVNADKTAGQTFRLEVKVTLFNAGISGFM
jgi:hypothetical protein